MIGERESDSSVPSLSKDPRNVYSLLTLDSNAHVHPNFFSIAWFVAHTKEEEEIWVTLFTTRTDTHTARYIKNEKSPVVGIICRTTTLGKTRDGKSFSSPLLVYVVYEAEEDEEKETRDTHTRT